MASFNRTFMELKLVLAKKAKIAEIAVLIVPLWNWNWDALWSCSSDWLF